MLDNLFTKITDQFAFNENNIDSAIDVLVVKDNANNFKCSYFNVVFGKFKVLHTQGKIVDLYVNGKHTGVEMELGKNGEGYFEQPSTTITQDNYDRIESLLINNDDLSQQEKLQNDYLRKYDSKNYQRFCDISKDINEEYDLSWNWDRKSESFSSYNQLTDFERQNNVIENILPEDGLKSKDKFDNPVFEYSLSGDKVDNNMTSLEVLQTFYNNIVTYEDFMNNPNKVLSRQNMMMKIDNKIYNCNKIVSRMAFNKGITKEHIDSIEGLTVFRSFSPELLESRDIKNLQFHGKSSGTLQTNLNDVSHDKTFVEEKTLVKTLKLNSENQQRLDQKIGKNELKYVIRGGSEDQYLQCDIFLTKDNVELVVFDIDGTITLHDDYVWVNGFGVFGFQKNVGNLATKIKENGYFVIYLTARFRWLQQCTEILMKEIKSIGESLPDGPVFHDPNISDVWVKTELINQDSDHYKMLTLNTVLNLFPPNKKITAGFGNSSTDTVSYSAIGINHKKIFIVNPSSEIYCLGDDIKYTYKKILENIDTILPK